VRGVGELSVTTSTLVSHAPTRRFDGNDGSGMTDAWVEEVPLTIRLDCVAKIRRSLKILRRQNNERTSRNLSP
jgi:hypothetical protein